MKTYAQVTGQETFDWNAFLDRKKKTIKKKDWKIVEEIAQNWTTCACGNQCSIIPRELNGEPVDKKLTKLGGDSGFYGAILDRDKKLAKKFLKKIEKRSAKLIKKEIRKAKEIIEKSSDKLTIDNLKKAKAILSEFGEDNEVKFGFEPMSK